jgi:hypothetical protein
MLLLATFVCVCVTIVVLNHHLELYTDESRFTTLYRESESARILAWLLSGIEEFASGDGCIPNTVLNRVHARSDNQELISRLWHEAHAEAGLAELAVGQVPSQ